MKNQIKEIIKEELKSILKESEERVSDSYLTAHGGYGKKSDIGTKRIWGKTKEGIPYYTTEFEGKTDVVIMKPAGKYQRIFSDKGGFFDNMKAAKLGIEKFVRQNIKKYKLVDESIVKESEHIQTGEYYTYKGKKYPVWTDDEHNRYIKVDGRIIDIDNESVSEATLPADFGGVVHAVDKTDKNWKAELDKMKTHIESQGYKVTIVKGYPHKENISLVMNTEDYKKWGVHMRKVHGQPRRSRFVPHRPWRNK